MNIVRNDGNMTSTVRSVEEHKIAPLLVNGQKVRLEKLTIDVNLPLYEKALSGLYVPLRFRGQTIGILCVESIRSNAFNLYDESLIVVIASHLASLADYTRLREEAEGRARNLGLSMRWSSRSLDSPIRAKWQRSLQTFWPLLRL